MNELSSEDLEWIIALRNSIWEEREYPYNFHRVRHASVARQLTTEELHRVVDIAQRTDIFVLLGSGEMGFGYGMTLMRCSPYPGVDPIPLIGIVDNHIPIPDRTLQRNFAWDTFSSLALTPSNNHKTIVHGFPVNENNPAKYDY